MFHDIPSSLFTDSKNFLGIRFLLRPRTRRNIERGIIYYSLNSESLVILRNFNNRDQREDYQKSFNTCIFRRL